MHYRKLFDFMASLILTAIGVFAIVSGLGIHKDSGGTAYESPGFMPLVLGIALVVCSLLLLSGSLGEGGPGARLAELKTWLREKAGSKDTGIMLTGILIMFVYSFYLFRLLPFWISSFIFLVGIIAYLKATTLVKGLLVSAGTIAFVVLFFQIGFRVQLP